MKTKYLAFFIILAALVFASSCSKRANFNNEEAEAFVDELKDEHSEISFINFKISDVSLTINIIWMKKFLKLKEKRYSRQ